MIGKEAIRYFRKGNQTIKNQLLSVEVNQIYCEVDLFHLDAYTFILHTLTMEHKHRDEDQSLVERQIQFIKNTILYLPERLRLVEWDKAYNQAQLRSEVPDQQDDKKYYFETFLDGGTRISLKRFCYTFIDQNRFQITFTLTDTIVERLINDFAKCLTLN